jgi:hypothetical protein
MSTAALGKPDRDFERQTLIARLRWNLERPALQIVGAFIRLLTSAISSGRAHLADLLGDAPKLREQACGWRRVTIGTGGYQREELQSRSDRVGWVDRRVRLFRPRCGVSGCAGHGDPWSRNRGIRANSLAAPSRAGVSSADRSGPRSANRSPDHQRAPSGRCLSSSDETVLTVGAT